jgi:hypothetical protein
VRYSGRELPAVPFIEETTLHWKTINELYEYDLPEWSCTGRRSYSRRRGWELFAGAGIYIPLTSNSLCGYNIKGGFIFFVKYSP